MLCGVHAHQQMAPCPELPGLWRNGIHAGFPTSLQWSQGLAHTVMGAAHNEVKKREPRGGLPQGPFTPIYALRKGKVTFVPSSSICGEKTKKIPRNGKIFIGVPLSLTLYSPFQKNSFLFVYQYNGVLAKYQNLKMFKKKIKKKSQPSRSSYIQGIIQLYNSVS